MAETAPDPLAARIARVNELSALARTNWFTLLAYLAFVGVTLLAVEDADFFVPARQTDLPLVGVSIPTARFFMAAPLLGAALYVYLHIHLTKLWEVLAPLRREAGAEALADRVYPWLVNDLVLHLPGEGQAAWKPLATLAGLVTRALVWFAGPIVLAGFWWRSMPAHDEWLTLWLALCLMVASYAGFVSWWKLRGMLAGREATASPWTRLKRGAWRTASVVVVALSWLRTEGGTDHYVHKAIDAYESAVYGNRGSHPFFSSFADDEGERLSPEEAQRQWVASRPWILELEDLWFEVPFSSVFLWAGFSENDEGQVNPFAPTDLAGVAMVEVPPDWRDHETARRAFRVEWCEMEGIPAGACGRVASASEPVPDEIWTVRAPLCAGRKRSEDCRDYFSELDQAFAEVWEVERAARLAAVSDLSLVGKDLRAAHLSGATLNGVDLQGARLEGAYLVEARLEGAELAHARLERADLSGAQLEGANLFGAWMIGAELFMARMAGAKLSAARLEYANLVAARLENAVLTKASLRHANLSEARLDDANLFGTSLEGAELFGARLNDADLRLAILRGADLSTAHLEGADLSDAWLDDTEMLAVSLDSATLSGARLVRANLVGARLVGADLSGAQLKDADLMDALLEGVNLSDAQLDGAQLSRADVSFGQWAGSPDRSMTTSRAQLSLSINDGAMLRFADLSEALGLSESSFFNSFGDATVKLPGDLTAPCHWSDIVLDDVAFFGRWRWWLEKGPAKASKYAHDELNWVPVYPPPPGHPDHDCEWSPTPKPIPRASPATE